MSMTMYDASSDRGSFTNYVDKILAFLTTYTPPLTFSMAWTLTKSGHFWTTYLPCLVNVVCERPLMHLNNLSKLAFLVNFITQKLKVGMPSFWILVFLCQFLLREKIWEDCEKIKNTKSEPKTAIQERFSSGVSALKVTLVSLLSMANLTSNSWL